MTQTKKYSLRNNNSKNKKNGNNKQVHRKCNLLQFQPFSMFCMLLCLDPNRCKKYHVIISTQKQVSSETECTSAGSNPAGIHMFKMNQRNTRTRCEICSKLTIKTPECRSGVLIFNFEHISHLALVFSFLTLNR